VNRRWGIATAVLSAICYGASLPLSRLAYDHGTNPLTIIALRYLAIVLLLGVWLRVSGSPFRIPPRLLLASALVGVCFLAVSGGLLTSVTFIPVNLTVVVFYTYPMLTLLIVSAMERRTPSAAELVAVILAMAGVGLAMQVSVESLNVEGVGFALLAAIGVAGSFIVAHHILPSVGATRMTLYACITAFAGGVTMMLGFDALAVPDSAFGIGLVGAVIAMFAVAVIAMFAAVRLIGPVRVATCLCLEPVTAIFVAVLVLGEHLKGGQWLGVALVGVALLITARRPAAPASAPANPP